MEIFGNIIYISYLFTHSSKDAGSEKILSTLYLLCVLDIESDEKRRPVSKIPLCSKAVKLEDRT